MPKKIITCTGYGNSGSSAGTNFFEEFSNVKSFCSGIECTFLHEADGLFDLENAFKEGHRLKIDLAVKRFLKLAKKFNKETRTLFNGKLYDYSKDYIEELCLCKWDGGWHRAFECEDKPNKTNYEFARYFFNKEAKKSTYGLYESDSWKPSYETYTDMYYGGYERFEEVTKQYIARLFNECDTKNEYAFILIDQLLPPIKNYEYSKYFNSIKTIVIDRDPRDLFYANKVYWGSRYIPSADVDTFIKWYALTRQEKQNTSSILYLYLEDFIYHYDETREKLINFIGSDKKDHIKQFEKFDPKKSIVNTRLWTKNNLFDKEIKLIEGNLKDFCFDYSNIDCKEEKINESSFVFEKAMLNADRLQKEKKSFGKKLNFIFCDTESLSLFKILKHSKENLKKNFVREVGKLVCFTISLPFEWSMRFIKTLGLK